MPRLFAFAAAVVVLATLAQGCTTFSTTSLPVEYTIIAAPADVVWAKTLEVLPSENITVDEIEPTVYFLKGTKAFSLRSNGEYVIVKLHPREDGRTFVRINATTVSQLIGWGHAEKVCRDLFRKIKTASEGTVNRK
jgi:hypothetical protein